MARTSPMRAGGVVAVVILVAAVLLAVLRPGTSTVTVDTSPPVEPPDDGTAVVASMTAPGGFAPFGVQIVDPTHTIEVRFLSDPGCAALLTPGDPWPVPNPECPGPDGVTGTIGGLGVTPDGRSIVGVRFSVSGPCYDHLTKGMAWPTDLTECSG